VVHPVFTVVPVVDIRNGIAVQARAGDRANYAPLSSPLVTTPEPATALAGLMSLFPFRAVYVADLDAIERGQPNIEAIAAMAAAAPAAELWLDAGVAGEAAVRAATRWGAGRVVIGSESQAADDLGLAVRLEQAGVAVALSLDFHGEAFAGPPALWSDPALWPDTLIVMTLARVGTGSGPDMARLADVKGRAGARRVFAAGGVRGLDDLAALAEAGIAGALIATALHDGRIGAADLARWG
jgi:phosphoribosylformimino-5-aminoimidazole carboxamide ribotide isomerase